MKHLIMKKCLKNARWNGYTLQCSCGRNLAIRYMIDQEVRLFYYGRFEKYKQDIIGRKDTKQINKRYDLFGNLGDEEWEEILRDIKQRKEYT